MQNVRRFVVKKGPEAREQLLEGVFFGADAVRRTLGPYGRNGISGIRGGTPHISNDGVSILRELWIDNEIQMLGLRTMREAALKLNDMCGDGTTTAAVLTYNILLEGTKRLGYTLVDPATGKYQKGTVVGGTTAVMDIKRQIDAESKIAIDKLVAMAKPVGSREELIGAVRVSAEDEGLAEMIGGMQFDLGSGGTIIVEDTNEQGDSIERVMGIRFDNGFPTSRVINNQEKQLLELEDVHVIYTNDSISTLANFRAAGADEGAGVLDTINLNLKKLGKPVKIVIIARKFDQLAMQEIAENFKHGLEIYPINAPYVNQTQIFKDLRAILGGTFIDVEENRSLRDATLSDVGFATKVQASRWNAIFAGPQDEKATKRIEERLQVLQKERKGEKSTFAAQMLDARMASLTNGLGLMKVGGLSESDQKRKRDKVDDAVASARSALQEGLVPGGGQALKTVAAELPEGSILGKALCSIYEQIQANAGQEFPIEPWVKDPVKVLRLAVEIASSVAGALVTAEIAIDHEHPKPRWIYDEAKVGDDDVGPDGTRK